VHLAPGGDDPPDIVADREAVAPVGLTKLAIGRRVQVEAVDANPDLIVGELRRRVETPGGLREHARRSLVGVGDTVQPKLTGETFCWRHECILPRFRGGRPRSTLINVCFYTIIFRIFHTSVR
jgi:hypothetical protein